MINPKSLENLRSFKELDEKTHKELSSKGGKASGESRRKFKRLKKTFDAYMMYFSHRETFEHIAKMNSKQLAKAMKKLEEI